MKVRVRTASFAGVFPYQNKRLPQVAFAGRSNVGKSSLINALVNRKGLVHTSKTPGKTQSVNLYLVDLVELPLLYLVDLPGYGYAKAPKSVVSMWAETIRSYLTKNDFLRLLVLLVDIRRDLGDYEHMLIDTMSSQNIPVAVAATKADKVGHGERLTRVRHLAEQSGGAVIVTSAPTRMGMDDVWDAIAGALGHSL